MTEKRLLELGERGEVDRPCGPRARSASRGCVLRSFNLGLLQEPVGDAVVCSLTRALDLLLEMVRVERRELLPTRALFLLMPRSQSLGAIKVAACNS